MKHCITISVDESQEKDLRDRAAEQRRPFSWAAREVIAAGLVALSRKPRAPRKAVAK